ncbi:glycosyltransferase [Methanolacinia paynteri]|uniref:glycosyltransferase n=1 Tax=Methanolacinia paynteri TaxID=230356 RepID=UPI00064E9175|nr:glycosyltransferase family 2 protein [Methanolacinia paynteri]
MIKYDISVIIPTFNEAENIENIIRAVSGILTDKNITGEILVVDDDSGDGTKDIVRRLQDSISGLNFIIREEDHGLSQSVVEGFEKAQADIIQVIDADFSHPPQLIPDFYKSIKEDGFDIVIGSRYMKGGDIKNWPVKRRIISLGATAFGRVLFPEITDPVSGFFAIKKEVIANARMKPRGYKILMEVLGKGTWEKAKEIPFIFKDREEGESKLKLSTMIDYILQCTDIGVYALKNHNTYAWKEWKKIFKFGLVGASGIVVNTGILYAVTEYFGIYYMISSVFAIEASIATNFILNDTWTFDGANKSHMGSRWKRFVSFQLISVCGVGINLLVLFALTEFAGIYYLFSNIVGIFIAFAWNFLVNRHITWKNKTE